MLLTKFQVNWLVGLGEEVKNRFSRWPPWQPSWISNQHDFSYFWSTSHPDANYQVWSQLAFGFRKRSEKKIFQDGHHRSHLGLLISTILAIFDLQVTLMLPTKFGVNWPFGSGDAAKNRFSRWRPCRPSWISDRIHFSYFWSTSHPDASYQVSSQLPFGFRRRSETPWRPSKIYDRQDFSYFWSTSHPNASYQVSSQLAFQFRRKSKK